MPLKTILSKCLNVWKLSGEVSMVDMGNGFTLLKFTNAIDCNSVLDGQPWFMGGQIYSLQRWKPNFDPVKESLLSVLLWIRLPRLPLEMWNVISFLKFLSPLVVLSN